MTRTQRVDAEMLVADGFRFDPGMGQRRTEFIAFVDWLALEIDPKCVIEIGAGRGGSTYVFAQLSRLVISIDLPDGNGGLSFDDCRERNLRLENVGAVECLVGSSRDPAIIRDVQEILSVLHGQRADLVFIDGDHTEEAVRADWHTYSRMVRPGGAVALHDINSAVWPGIARLWSEIAGQKVEFSDRADWGGIGVVRV